MNIFTGETLDVFVQNTDKLGGPGSADVGRYWEEFCFKPRFMVNESLDPFSEEYCQQQIKLYQEISGRAFDQSVNELVNFDIERHVACVNAFCSDNPSSFVSHYLRLGCAIQRAQLPVRPKILDMGAGWGVSSEFFALLGATVTAVDINPNFVELIERRQRNHRMPVKAIEASFDGFESGDRFDACVFYECLHHALAPWLVLKHVANFVKDDGKIIFAGEPIFNQWRNWGIRFDPLSIYCMRKYGWFEAGWTVSFISQCFLRAGFLPSIEYVSVPGVGYNCVAAKLETDKFYDISQIRSCLDPSSWIIGDKFAASRGYSHICLPEEREFQSIVLHLSNFRPSTLQATVFIDQIEMERRSIPTGESRP
jgi:2-polyprenyl-3-methyl-5-hydroxy-6-metoxy-1,4-benzoquinol methylase